VTHYKVEGWPESETCYTLHHNITLLQQDSQSAFQKTKCHNPELHAYNIALLFKNNQKRVWIS